MPVLIKKHIFPVPQAEFMAIDHKVMHHAFTIHNRYGPFCDEKIYGDELAYLCEKDGLNACRETQVSVTHQSFTKNYFIDLVIEESLVYELKISRELASDHEQQLLNYLLLTNVNHGKLLTFGGASVQHRFVSTKLNYKKRHEYTVNADAWVPFSRLGKRLLPVLSALLADWGSFLSVSLYRQAMASILSNGLGLEGTVQLLDGDRLVGMQKELLLAPDIVFCITGSSGSLDGLRKHLIHFLNVSSAQAIQWINFDHHQIKIETIKK